MRDPELLEQSKHQLRENVHRERQDLGYTKQETRTRWLTRQAGRVLESQHEDEQREVVQQRQPGPDDSMGPHNQYPRLPRESAQLVSDLSAIPFCNPFLSAYCARQHVKCQDGGKQEDRQGEQDRA